MSTHIPAMINANILVNGILRSIKIDRSIIDAAHGKRSARSKGEIKANLLRNEDRNSNNFELLIRVYSDVLA